MNADNFGEQRARGPDAEVLMTFVESGYVFGGALPKLENNVSEGNFIQKGAKFRKEIPRCIVIFDI